MSAKLGSKLITQEMVWNANMTEQNHLGLQILAKPHKLSGTMDLLFTSKNYYSGNPLSSELLSSKFGKETIGTTEWEWELKGANTRPLIALENVEPESNTTPGKWGRTFKLKLDENWFLAGDYLHPGTSDKRFQVRVQKNPVPHGDGWIYEVVMASGNHEDFMPVKYLKYGQQWAKMFSKYEEAAEQSGSTIFSSPLAMKNKMSLYRKEYRVTNYAATEVLAVKIPVEENGKITYVPTWMRYAEIEYWRQWYQEMERAVWYSRSSETVIGANGRPVRSGPGVLEQLEDANSEVYSHLTARFLEDYLMDIFYSRVKPGQRKTIKGYSGEIGMLQFHRAISNVAERRGIVLNIEQFTNKVNSPYHANALEYGYQYTKYNMANGISIELIHNPLFDDRDINFEIDPITGYPVESQRIVFLDFSGEDAISSNIKIMEKKDGFAFAYINGLYGPAGPSKGGTAAHSGSYYEMHVERSFGVHIHDVTKCGDLRFSRA